MDDGGYGGLRRNKNKTNYDEDDTTTLETLSNNQKDTLFSPCSSDDF